VCVCSLTCPACNARESYCHLWPVRLYNSFPHYITNGKLNKNLFNITCVCFLYKYASHSKKKRERVDHESIFVLM